jgi:hypothetical protein
MDGSTEQRHYVIVLLLYWRSFELRRRCCKVSQIMSDDEPPWSGSCVRMAWIFQMLLCLITILLLWNLWLIFGHRWRGTQSSFHAICLRLLHRPLSILDLHNVFLPTARRTWITFWPSHHNNPSLYSLHQSINCPKTQPLPPIQANNRGHNYTTASHMPMSNHCFLKAAAVVMATWRIILAFGYSGI